MASTHTPERPDIDSAARLLTGTSNQATAEDYRGWAKQNFGRTAAIYRRCAELVDRED